MSLETPDITLVDGSLSLPQFPAQDNRHIARAAWWLAYPVAIALLACLDLLLAVWHPFPSRLPEQFSPAYLQQYIADAPKGKRAIAFLGDSVLWGYKIRPEQTAVYQLRRAMPNVQMLNLAYEGGSTPNSAIMLRYLLEQHVRPAAVVMNLNVKEFNAADSAYQTLHPSLERAAANVLTAADAQRLTYHTPHDLNARLNAFMEQAWRLYRFRTDIREALFGTDDMAGALTNAVQGLTGTTKEKELEHRPTPDRFLGTYDLSPIAASNVGMRYYKELISSLCTQRIPALIFLTPTNHALLHDYIDVPDYDANLARLMNVPHCSGVRIINFDRAIPAQYFIDNDHLNPHGQQLLASKLYPYVRSMVR